MKKAALLIILVSAIFLKSNSQNVDDALRYSQIFYNGSARFMGMGGAFSALGGDLSSISLNPAGTGVFRTPEFSITLPQMYYNNNSANWNGLTKSNFTNPWRMGQIGAVISIIPAGSGAGLVNLNLAYSFNRTNNFSESITIQGVSNNSSITDSWIAQANGNTKSQLPDAAWLANQTYLIDTLSGSNTQYASILSYYGENANNSYGQTIKRVITNEGYSAEHAISIGGNLSNIFYFGATLGINKIDYSGLYQHEEIDDANIIYDFKNLTYTDHLEATGTGYSLKLGAIVKPIESLRLSLALHSPVYYRISEYYFDNLTSTFDTFVDGQNKYEASNSPMRYKYTLTTPFRVITGVAVQIKKLALLSLDYDYVNYSMAQFSKASDGYNYSNENQSIKDILKSTSNVRLGAEFRISNIYLRGGYSYYGKAFKSTEPNKNLNYQGPSIGFGFRQQRFYFDMAYSRLSGTSKYYMYDDPGYLDPASITTSRNTITATLGFKF
jgi:long-subunit fatty acid transport protein